MGRVSYYHWNAEQVAVIRGLVDAEAGDRRKQRLRAVLAMATEEHSLTRASDEAAVSKDTLRRFIKEEVQAGTLPEPFRYRPATAYIVEDDLRGAAECLERRYQFGRRWKPIKDAAVAAYLQQQGPGEWCRRVFACVRSHRHGEAELGEVLRAAPASVLRHPWAKQLADRVDAALHGACDDTEILNTRAYDYFEYTYDGASIHDVPAVRWDNYPRAVDALEEAESLPGTAATRVGARWLEADEKVTATRRMVRTTAGRSNPSCRAYIATLLWLWQGTGRPELDVEAIALEAFVRGLAFGDQGGTGKKPDARFLEAVGREVKWARGSTQERGVMKPPWPIEVSPETVYVLDLLDCFGGIERTASTVCKRLLSADSG